MAGVPVSEAGLRCRPFKKGLLGAMADRVFSDAGLRCRRFKKAHLEAVTGVPVSQAGLALLPIKRLTFSSAFFRSMLGTSIV